MRDEISAEDTYEIAEGTDDIPTKMSLYYPWSPSILTYRMRQGGRMDFGFMVFADLYIDQS